MLFIAIDVAKALLEFACRPTGETGMMPNAEDGIRDLVARCQVFTPALIVLEATGGYEAAAVAALATAGLPVVVANPRRVRDVAKATGQLASGTWNVFFDPVHLGWLDERDYRIHDHRGRTQREHHLSPIR